MKTTKKHRYYIGIDTGVQTGLCIWDRQEKRIYRLETTKLHHAWELVKYYYTTNPGDVKVCVEDPRLAVFGRRSDLYKAQGAGSVKRDAKAWEDFLKDLGVDFEMVRPDSAITKLDDQTFRKVTGWTGKTSSHARDAAMLVYGR